ncbi:hydrogenase maturation protease [Consotaella aegiceratis]|uniref:hydrogenase maturation protease n=1 Tax=Consotaella aegiceratis TaxID=3097961 RepID=UPI002F41893E
MDEAATGLRAVLVLGIGNPGAGDDGVGPAVAQMLQGRAPSGVVVRARQGDMLALIDDWQGFEAVICIDAASGESGTGHIHRFDLTHGGRADLQALAQTSSHGFGLPEAVELARVLGRTPGRLIVYAVEGASFEPGAAMSPEAVSAAKAVAEHVLADVERLLARHPVE